jgi:glycosylphosphatidylinositol deacylase
VPSLSVVDVHLSGFGREFTRMGNGPWGLYLYREAGWDQDPYVGTRETADLTKTAGIPGNEEDGCSGQEQFVPSLSVVERDPVA